MVYKSKKGVQKPPDLAHPQVAEVSRVTVDSQNLQEKHHGRICHNYFIDIFS